MDKVTQLASRARAFYRVLAARGKSHAGAKNGDCHQFASRHDPRNKAFSLNRIGWLYPIFRRILPAMILSLAIPAASGSTGKLLSLRLVPEEVKLWGAGAVQRVLVLGRFADGLERDVTQRSKFSISDSTRAKLKEPGQVVAVADGQATLTAEVDGAKAQVNVQVAGSEQTRPFSFARDVGGIFTKRGCNSNDCHGSVKGKGGFKLSANALYPKEDYEWVVEGGTYQVLAAGSDGARVPRINLEDPEKSLLLAKPAMQVAHGGGPLIAVGSADYETILNWIRQGALYGEEDDTGAVQVERIEVLPKSVVLDGSGKRQLLVTAYLSNGQQEDVSGQVLYVSNNPEVVEVSESGLVKAVKTGETAVMIRAAGHAVSAGFGVISEPIADYPEIPRRNYIDDHVFAKLKKFNIIPSETASDEEFLRRVCLDVTGTLPPPDRVLEFLNNTDPNKRDKLIDILLDSPEYIDYWTFRFADLYRVAMGPQGDLKNTKLYWEWVRDKIARNVPYDQIARERIAAQGYDGPSRHYYHVGGELPTPGNMMSEQLRVFLGRRLDCAQCHNHPYEKWSQDQYWGLAAFFGRLSRIGELGKDMLIIDDPAGHGEFGQGAKVIHPRTKSEVEPTFLDGRALAEDERTDLRMRLAEWATSQAYFDEAIVNRMWGLFFSRGIVDPVDDFRLTNPPTHPELLETLAKDFRENRHDLKYLIRLITQSQTYQLSSDPNRTNKDDKINYSHSIARPLDPEVLLDAVSQVTGVYEEFDNWMYSSEPPGMRAINLPWPDAVPSQFMDVYGRPNRLTVPERKVKANLGQALHLLAGPTYTSKLAAAGSRIDRLVKRGASDGEIIDEFYMAALVRLPTAEERDGLEEAIAAFGDRREALQDLAWALIATREFAFNH